MDRTELNSNVWKRSLLPACGVMLALTAVAQTEQNDTVKTDTTKTITARTDTARTDTSKTAVLGEAVVEAQMQRTSSAATTYIPSADQKRAAQNALDLLRRMAIPQLQISLTDDKVKDNSGEEVSLFINFMPATQEDKEGLRTTDVLRVEYLEFPTDPRFQGAPRVVHIILQEYAYGGYTKFTGREDFLIGLSSKVNVFSKFTYKKMTYDFFVGTENLNCRHISVNTVADYSLKDADGNDYTLTRSETSNRTRYRKDSYPVTFRATYNSEKIQIRNTLGYTHNALPTQQQIGTLTYSPGMAEDYQYERNNPSRENSLSYQGIFNFFLPHKFSLSLTPQVSYSHTNDALTYVTSLSDPIQRNARENAYFYRLDASMNKRFGEHHTLSMGLHGSNTGNRLRYSGNVAYSDRFHNAFESFSAGYQFKSKKFNSYTALGFCWEQSGINEVKNSDAYPFLHVILRYSPNTKNSFSTYFQYANNTPGLEWKTSDLLRDNEFLYLTGNPLIENARHVTFNLSYNWFPSNRFSMSVFGNYFKMFDRMIAVYDAYDNGRALLRTYRNDGDYVQGSVGATASLKLFKNKLQLYVRPEQRFLRSTGVYDKTYCPFQIYAQASCYLKQFHFDLFYQTAQKSMFSASPVINRSRDDYGLEAGWANSVWNIRLTAANLFRTSWDASDRFTEAPLFKERRTYLTNQSHACIRFSVTYTFGYGKKVQRGNEVGAQQGAASGILK